MASEPATTDSAKAPARGARRPARGRREQARASVMRAALELAGERPYRDLTVEEIAAAAGISRSAFYLHFSDKGELIEAAAAEVSGELGAAAARCWRGEGAPAARIRRAVEGFVTVYAEHRRVLAVITEAASYDERVRALWMEIIGRFISATAEHLAAEQRRGLVPDRLDAGSAAEALVWMSERCCFLYLDRGRSAEEVAAQLSTVWTAALYPGVVPARELQPGSSGGHLWGVPAPKFE
jgi:TetR/AcrR family transcriptional regulator, ethionamide resistance regulator